MIENSLKDKIFAIISYCDTDEKVDVLVRNINLIRERFPEYKIAHQSNYPLSEKIQRMTDMYFYQDLNFTGNDKWIYYWNIIANPEHTHTYFKKKFFYSILDTGFSVFQQIKVITKYLIDYQWVMLINYDTSVEEIWIEDYGQNYNQIYDGIFHYFPDHKAVSLIIMGFNPWRFYHTVAIEFTYENWMKPQRTDQLNEERFLDMINESGFKYFAHDYKISDKISGEPDYLKPNAPPNEYFTNYLLYYHDNLLEIYLWGLLKEIENITLKIDGMFIYLKNKNELGAFECEVNYYAAIVDIKIVKINEIYATVPLEIKRGYSTREI